MQDGSRHLEQARQHAGQTPARKSGVDATYQRFSLNYLLEILFRRKRTIILPVIRIILFLSNRASYFARKPLPFKFVLWNKHRRQ